MKTQRNKWRVRRYDDKKPTVWLVEFIESYSEITRAVHVDSFLSHWSAVHYAHLRARGMSQVAALERSVVIVPPNAQDRTIHRVRALMNEHDRLDAAIKRALGDGGDPA